ncbi:hypothetical protein ES703_105756 [subsurface metagenome]
MEIRDPKQPTEPIDNSPVSVCALEARATTDRTPPHRTYGDKKRREFEPRFSTAKLLYKTVDDLDNKNFFSRIEECRSGAFFVRHEETGDVRVRSFHCGLRWCPICASSRQAWISTECERWFRSVTGPRLVTLTVRHTNAPLADQINSLYNHFQKFRKRKFFKDRTRGGVWFFHIKKSQKDHKWHPHLHCLIDSDFLEHEKIMQLWHKITGDSKIVHIKAVTNPTNSVKHAARYSAEPCDLSTLSPIDALEVYYALSGRRLAGTWGTARMISFRPKPEPDAKKWTSIGSYDMVRQLKDSDDNARAIWKAYCLGKPVEAGVSMYNLELEVYDNFIHAPPKFDPQGRFNFAA